MASNTLNELRSQVDEIDSQLVRLLESRYLIVTKILQHKEEHTLPLTDSTREQEILDSHKDSSLSPSFLKSFFSLLFSYSKQLSKKP